MRGYQFNKLIMNFFVLYLFTRLQSVFLNIFCIVGYITVEFFFKVIEYVIDYVMIVLINYIIVIVIIKF